MTTILLLLVIGASSAVIFAGALLKHQRDIDAERDIERHERLSRVHPIRSTLFETNYHGVNSPWINN